MELRHMRYFIAVAEELNFTSAAGRLRIAQPPLSKQIQDLELELGTPLFKRTTRRVELTSAGLVFLEQARGVLAHAEQAVERARAVGFGQVGVLEIATTGSVLMGHLGPLIAAFSKRFPDVSLRIHELPP